tara:strand:+ start:225 stop:716 length:492 start_codon:yes stop_codon:yes gene_type:complete
LTYCKQIPIPILDNVSIEKILFIYSNAGSLWNTRYNHDPWKSIDLISEGKDTAWFRQFSEIKLWRASLYKFTGIKHITNMYLSVLAPRNQVPWHTDLSNDVFASTILTSIQTDNSFLEFENNKYVYKTGYSYLLRTYNKHRIMNLNNEPRITLCTTPKENPYV